jgi:excisionase family DNA binding protein
MIPAINTDDSPQMKTLTMKETCKRLGISYSTARYAVDRGDIPAIRIGRTLRVPEALLARKMGLVA